MATYCSKRKFIEMTKTELLEEVKHLYSENNDLKQKVRQAEHPGRLAKESLQAVQLRCAKHRREKKRLERLSFILRVAFITIVVVCVPLILYAIMLALDDYGLQIIGLSPMYFSTNLKWLIDDKVGSLLVATLGFSICIPSQMTFPAPNLSFIGVFLFAIKQVIILFLPKWCIGFVSLFALFTIGTLYFDRNQQVSSF